MADESRTITVVPTEAKRCTKCGEVKPPTDYYVKREGSKTRLASHCKACHINVTNRWQANNRQKMRALRRGYHAAAPEVRREQGRTWRAENPEIPAAHAAVRHALSQGDLIRPDTCERCTTNPGLGHDGRSLLEAHHDDYSQPLIVRWLCSSCHKRQHKG